MGLLEYYLIFSITTSLVATILMCRPVLSEVRLKNPTNPLVEYMAKGYVIVFLLLAIVAPLVFIVLLRKSSIESFKFGLLKALLV